MYMYIVSPPPVDLVSLGVGYHHAGMSTNDRRNIETVFCNGELPVLCMYMYNKLTHVFYQFISSFVVSTSTLAMGVSRPPPPPPLLYNVINIHNNHLNM